VWMAWGTKLAVVSTAARKPMRSMNCMAGLSGVSPRMQVRPR
jgi:hypothetical protein